MCTALVDRDDAQGAFAGHAIVNAYAGNSIGIIDDGSVYCLGLADMFKSALNAAGVTEALHETSKPGENDYNDLVQITSDRQLLADHGRNLSMSVRTSTSVGTHVLMAAMVTVSALLK